MAIWCNLQMLGPFLIVVTMTGGLLAFFYVLVSVWLPLLVPFLQPYAAAMARGGSTSSMDGEGDHHDAAASGGEGALRPTE
ncbi:MAG: hypothetical protein R3C97_13155 [Geminicoccaceae bacterium]